ncbi:protease modulator HflC [Dethiosulfovibrio salsuginis]|uniref:Protein HflC n=1 Tax=Dethiosulfovibrio salsuginis TaxID=561720 RepID=A0A1X7IE60_9BACT|nr:protease modulator HflC [Dethiosulfovibrio salsuginis]SMG12511.1 protease FtsH subunit HflC [Dethiosulfovibrio salsuginis]
MKYKKAIIYAVLLVLLGLSYDSFYVIRQDEQAVILRLGKIVATKKSPGISMKIPFTDTVVRYTKRLIEYDASPVSVVMADKKNIIFDSIAIFQITDPEAFRRRVRTISAVQQRLDDSVYAAVRAVAGQITFDDILFLKRDEAEAEALRIAAEESEKYGVTVRTVEFKRLYLPQENEDAVYRSMEAERNRMSAQLISEGRAEAMKLRSAADRDKVEILASAMKESEEIKGEGDMKAQKLLADANRSAAGLYDFMKKLEFYHQVLPGRNVIVTAGDGVFDGMNVP